MCVHGCTFVCVWMCVCVWVCVCVCACMCVCTCLCTCMWWWMDVCMCVCMGVGGTCVHVCVHVHITGCTRLAPQTNWGCSGKHFKMAEWHYLWPQKEEAAQITSASMMMALFSAYRSALNGVQSCLGTCQVIFGFPTFSSEQCVKTYFFQIIESWIDLFSNKLYDFKWCKLLFGSSLKQVCFFSCRQVRRQIKQRSAFQVLVDRHVSELGWDGGMSKTKL